MDLIEMLGAGIAAIWFCAFVIIHVMGWRFGHGNAGWLLRCYAFTFLGTVVTAYGLGENWSTSSESIVLAVGIASFTSACLFVLYVPAVYVLLTSLSVQTLIMLRVLGDVLPPSVLYGRFANRVIVADRLGTLRASGYLSCQYGLFHLTGRGRRIAYFFLWIKKVWKLGPGG